MSDDDERTALRVEILVLASGLAPLALSSTAQLRAMLAGVKEQRAAYLAAGFVDESVLRT